jgi:hypothetical protein
MMSTVRAASPERPAERGAPNDPYGGRAEALCAQRGETGYLAVDRLVEALAGACVSDEELADLFADDAELDATVPQWRFAVRGAERVRAQLAHWFRDRGRFEELRRTVLPDGELVEFTLAWNERGVPHAAHQAHVLRIDAEGRIASDRMWCGGRWPASLLAEMAEAARADER